MVCHIFLGIISILHVNHGFLLDNVNTVHIYVNPNGSDNNTGTDLGNPVKTIEKALLRSDELGRRDKDIFIELTTGYYELESTLRVHNFRPRKLTIRAYQGQEVHVTGGKRINSSAFKRVTNTGSLQRLPSIARNKVLQVRLSDVGITDLGTLQTIGFYSKHIAPLEIFENEKPLTLARYPNKDYININQNYSDGKSFTYLSDRPKQWHNEHDVWAHGFWMWSWADRAIRIQHLDPVNKNITLASKTRFGLRPGHYNGINPTAVGFNHQGGYFRFVNVMSEIDEPGEYFVDRDNGVLYVWPSKDAPYSEKDQIYASIVPTCIDIIWSSANIVLEGFVIEACRQNGIHANNVQNLTITRMKIQNTGSDGIASYNGHNIKVNLCDIRNGDGGISISGGDQITLTPSGNEISDNIISNFGRVEYVGSDGISVDGVGIHVHHNTLFKGSYKGIDIRGNDHIFEYNHISKMCLKASDCGAIQSGRHFSWRGNVIRYNHIQDTQRLVPGADVRGVMLDDQLSGVLIENNVFNHNDVHVNIGGGRDNIVHQNIFYNTTQFSMQLDARGADGKWHTSDMLRYLNKIPYTNSLWSKRYPKLATIMAGHNPGDPVGNQVTENIFYAVGYPQFQTYGKKFQSDWFNVSNNIYISDVGSFSAPRYGNFKPGCLLKDFVKQTNFKDPVLPNQVGPRNNVGPLHIQTIQPDTGYMSGNSHSTSNCVVKPPAKQPTPVYLPDGSMANTLYKVPENKGCWFSFDKCLNHQELEKHRRPTSNQFYREIQAEQRDQSGTNETACLNKVPEMVNKCGSGSSFAVIYGPTGAMTLGGEGCYFARYYCPRTGWNATGFFEDKYADQKLNGAHNESVCLSRANAQWKWCGSSKLYPLASIFKPTGHLRAAGAGCWIKHEKCPADTTLKHMFYDGFGAANLQTDDNMDSCLSRAEYFWHHCGNHPEYKVTAYYRPRSVSATYPF